MGDASKLTVVTALAGRVLQTAVRCGLDRGQVLAAAHLDAAIFEGRDKRLPLEAFNRLWQLASEGLPGRVLALEILTPVQPGDFGVLGYVLAQMKTLEEALETANRYARLADEGAIPRLERSATTARVAFSVQAQTLAGQHQPEAMLTTLVSFIRRLVDPRFVPSAVHLPHPRTERTAALEQFFGTAVEHGRSGVAIEFPAEWLTRPLIGADPTLAAYLRQHAEATLARIEHSSQLRHETARRLAERLTAGEPSAAFIAKQMGLSERTLQRRLQAEGTTFNQLLQDTRRSIALGYLADRKLAAYEVGFLVGYSEPTTFFRAFKRWTGKTPQQYRASTV